MSATVTSADLVRYYGHFCEGLVFARRLPKAEEVRQLLGLA